MKLYLLERQANEFLKLAQEMGKSNAAGDWQAILQKANLWGSTYDPNNNSSAPFDLNSDVANVVFACLDAAKYKGKVSASVNIQPNLSVTISVKAANPQATVAIQSGLQRALAPKMSAALVSSKASPPQAAVTLPWLNQVGY